MAGRRAGVEILWDDFADDVAGFRTGEATFDGSFFEGALPAAARARVRFDGTVSRVPTCNDRGEAMLFAVCSAATETP